METDDALKTPAGAPSATQSSADSISAGDPKPRSGSPVTAAPASRPLRPLSIAIPTDHTVAAPALSSPRTSADEPDAVIDAPASEPPNSSASSRPKARLFVPKPVSPIASSASRNRVLNDRDISFFNMRKVARDIENNPLEDWEQQAAESDSQDGNREDTEEEASIVDLTFSSPDISASKKSSTERSYTAQKSSAQSGPSKKIATFSTPTATKKKKQVVHPKPTQSNTQSSSNNTPLSSTSRSKDRPVDNDKADKRSDLVENKSASEGARSQAENPEESLKRAAAIWTRAHEEYQARVCAETANVKYEIPPNPASDKYLLFNRPYLKRHPSPSRNEVGIAFDCLCCQPTPYMAWRPLSDSSTSLLSTHTKTKRSLDGQNRLKGAPVIDSGPLDRWLSRPQSPSKQIQLGVEETLTKMQARLMAVAWVTESARPLAIVEDKWFKEWLPMSRRNLVPDRKAVSRDVSSTYKAMQKLIKNRLKKVNGAIHIATDMWSSPNGHSFLGIIGCWHEEGKAQRHVLDMIPFTQRHTADHLAAAVLELARRFEITDKLWFIAGDNASSNTAMMKLLGQEDDLSRVQGQATQIRCIAHVLNLVSDAVIKPFNKVVKSSKDNAVGEASSERDWDTDEEVVEQSDQDEDDDSSQVADHEDDALSSSLHPEQDQDGENDRLIQQALAARNVSVTEETQASSSAVGVQIKQLAWFARKLRYNVRLRTSFQQTCSNFELRKPYSLIRDVATRWNSTYQMITRALVLWEGIVSWQDANPKIIPLKYRIKRTHKPGFERIVSLLKPLDDATHKFSAKAVPTIGDVLGTYEELDSHFRAVEADEGIGEVWREAARRASAVAAEYYGLTDDSHIYYLAIMLHPQMKKRFMEVMGWEHTWMERAGKTLRDVFNNHYRPHEPESQSQSQEPEQEQSKKPLSFLEKQLQHAAAKEALRPPPDPISEWCKSVLPIGKSGQLVDPLDWWWDQLKKGNDHGGLTRMALDVFSAPATSVDVERLFSKAGHHITPLRHRLKAIKIGEIVSVGAWFREQWVPKDLLADWHFEQQQLKLKARGKKRETDEEQAVEASPTKRARGLDV